jgi:hypothetical protein
MPLIEIPLHGKHVSFSLTMPEETVNDVKLYARFVKATHQSANSDIIAECIRRTLKQDAEFSKMEIRPGKHQKQSRRGPAAESRSAHAASTG